jgi:hypothetical protein
MPRIKFHLLKNEKKRVQLKFKYTISSAQLVACLNNLILGLYLDCCYKCIKSQQDQAMQSQ